MTDLDIQELANLTAGDADVDNFERLFTKLKEMKDKASSLPHEQRKVHAEKVRNYSLQDTKLEPVHFHSL
uniref:Uncharacterized protein n=1 Tax=Seriola lalandi dorsalis TaxID=1841481 RepID=A0A3B4XGQ4_SERLL